MGHQAAPNFHLGGESQCSVFHQPVYNKTRQLRGSCCSSCWHRKDRQGGEGEITEGWEQARVLLLGD